jgi:hypothetical protein
MLLVQQIIMLGERYSQLSSSESSLSNFTSRRSDPELVSAPVPESGL